jgi:hypothetical protein
MSEKSLVWQGHALRILSEDQIPLRAPKHGYDWGAFFKMIPVGQAVVLTKDYQVNPSSVRQAVLVHKRQFPNLEVRVVEGTIYIINQGNSQGGAFTCNSRLG